MPRDTLSKILHPLMKAPSVKTDCCAICGRHNPLEQHHIVRRSAGKLFRDGVEIPKPTITLCGFGNTLKDADNRYFCHGLAHANRLHFRYVEKQLGDGSVEVEIGHLEFILLDQPTNYQKALSMNGWQRIPRRAS